MSAKQKLEKIEEINNILRKYNLQIAPPRSDANIPDYLNEVKPILSGRISALLDKAEIKINEGSINEARKILKDVGEILKNYREIL